MGLFFNRDKKANGSGAERSFANTDDKEKVKPAIRCSICTGEQVAGFQDKETGRIEEVMLIREEADLENFCRMYGISGPVQKLN